MNWISVKDKMPPEETWLLLGILAKADDPDYNDFTIVQLGDYKKGEFKIHFGIEAFGDRAYKLGACLYLSRILHNFDPKETTHWMQIPRIDEG